MEKNIVETAVEAGNFTTLAKALGAAGLVDTLQGEGPYTVFAPTDEAFARVTATDIVASNGVIHVIDTVILPPNS